MNTVHEVVTVHHRTYARLTDSLLECREIKLEERPFVYVGAYMMAAPLLIVEREVLHRRHHSLLLHT